MYLKVLLHNKDAIYYNLYPKIAAFIVLVDKNNNILITKRNKNMRSYPNCWVVPGGGIDKSETIKETCLRELYEECGIEINKKYHKKYKI